MTRKTFIICAGFCCAFFLLGMALGGVITFSRMGEVTQAAIDANIQAHRIAEDTAQSCLKGCDPTCPAKLAAMKKLQGTTESRCRRALTQAIEYIEGLQ